MAREGIGRFAGASEYSDVDFLEILKGLLPYIKAGKINLNKVSDIDVVEKMDSAFCQFGINDQDVFFVETANSGEVTADNYKQKFSNEYFFGDFKASFESLTQNKAFQTALKKVHAKFGPVRYDAEIFPVLTHTGDETGHITFVATRYDRNKFGKDGAFVVFKSWIKDENSQWKRPDPKINTKLIAAIEHADSAVWRVYTNEKHAKLSGTIEFNVENLDEMLSSEKGINEALAVLKSRANTTMKAHLKNVIRDVKDTLQSVLDTYAEKTPSIFSKTGEQSPIEGIVLRLKHADGSIFEVKGTSNAFDQLKKQTWATRIEIGDLEAVLEGKFLKDVLGLKTSQPAAINTAIKKMSIAFTNSDPDAEKKEIQFLVQLYQSLREGGSLASPSETKQKVQNVFVEATAELTKIVDTFKAKESSLDPDSARKSSRALSLVIDKFKTIEAAIKKDIPDEQYQMYLFKFFLDRRLKTYAAQHMNIQSTDFSKYYNGLTPAIIWNGRAQPWHRGHDSMIQLAKKHMKTTGADKIVIFIVKGEATSKDTDHNPLTEADQKQLIETIYANDTSVMVSPAPLPTSSSSAVWAKLEPLKMYVVGWLAGEDRIDEYKKDVSRFNANMWVQDHATLPLKVNEKGTSAIEFILTPRVMSGTEARESAKTTDFTTWVQNVAPEHTLKDKKVIAMYKSVYNKINSAKMEAVSNLVRSKFKHIKENEQEDAAKAASSAEASNDETQRSIGNTNQPPLDTNTDTNPDKKLADELDPQRKLLVKTIDIIVNKLGDGDTASSASPTKPEVPSEDTHKKILNVLQNDEAGKKLDPKSLEVIAKGASSKKSAQDIVAELRVANGGSYDVTDDVKHVIGKALGEAGNTQDTGSLSENKSYMISMRKRFLESIMNIHELKGKSPSTTAAAVTPSTPTTIPIDDEQNKISDIIITRVKTKPDEKDRVISALGYLKSEQEKKKSKRTRTPGTRKVQKPEAPETPEDTSEKTENVAPENKPAAPYASMMGDPRVISDLSTLFKSALSLIVWIISKENGDAGNVLDIINGGISSRLDQMNDLVQKGQANAADLNKVLKESFKQLQESEKTMNDTYKTLSKKAQESGKNVDDLLKLERAKHTKSNVTKDASAKQLAAALKKLEASGNGKPIDPTFEKLLIAAAPSVAKFTAMKETDPAYAATVQTVVNEIKKYLTGKGAEAYPYLTDLIRVSEYDDRIRKSLPEIKAHKSSILHLAADRVDSLTKTQEGGEIEFFFLAEKNINTCLDDVAEILLKIKKKIDIKELQNKTKLSARTLNNWIAQTKTNAFNTNVIKAIGNQRAQ